jgi:hypothetical protein
MSTLSSFLAGVKAFGQAIASDFKAIVIAAKDDDGNAAPLRTNAAGELLGKVSPSADQDPIFDHAEGTKESVGTGDDVDVLTPPTGCKYARIMSDKNIVITTDGSTAAADDAAAVLILANQPEIVPVTAAAVVKALSLDGTATVRCMPYKVR